MRVTRVDQALDAIAARPEQLTAPVDLGQIVLACALAWLEFHGLAAPLRDGRAHLFAWFDGFARRPSMVRTAPRDAA